MPAGHPNPTGDDRPDRAGGPVGSAVGPSMNSGPDPWPQRRARDPCGVHLIGVADTAPPRCQPCTLYSAPDPVTKTTTNVAVSHRTDHPGSASLEGASCAHVPGWSP
jgi:hypothetical protein